MITPDCIQTYARYNHWQNEGLITICAAMPEADLTQDRGAFFGSILGTMNHLLWGDQIWMHRFAGWDKPPGGIAESPGLTQGFEAWCAARQQADAQICAWAETVTAADIVGDLTWMSGAVGRHVSKSRAMCLVHMFNHQTHHRGQIHAMLTAAGARPQDSDLIFMPDQDL